MVDMEKHQVKLYTSDGGMKLIKRCVATGIRKTCLKASEATHGEHLQGCDRGPVTCQFEDRPGGRLWVILAGQGAGAAFVVQTGDSWKLDIFSLIVLGAGWVAW